MLSDQEIAKELERYDDQRLYGIPQPITATRYRRALQALQQTRQDLRELCELVVNNHSETQAKAIIVQKKYGWTEGGEDAKTVK